MYIGILHLISSGTPWTDYKIICTYHVLRGNNYRLLMRILYNDMQAKRCLPFSPECSYEMSRNRCQGQYIVVITYTRDRNVHNIMSFLHYNNRQLHDKINYVIITKNIILCTDN